MCACPTNKNSDAGGVETEPPESKSQMLGSKEVLQVQQVDDNQTSEIGDMSFSNESGLNQPTLSQQSSHKSVETGKQDQAAYHAYRIRKTTTLVRRCIKSELKLPPSVVRRARQLLNSPDDLSVDEVEELNLKCQSAMQSEHFSESGSDTDENGMIHFRNQLIAGKSKIKTKIMGISSCSSGSKTSKQVSGSQSSFIFGHHQQGQIPYYQQQNYPYSFNQPPGYAPPNFTGFQYLPNPPNQYSQTPQFKFGTQTFAYQGKPESFQTPFRFQNVSSNKTAPNSPISPPNLNMSSTPKPTDADKEKVNAIKKFAFET